MHTQGAVVFWTPHNRKDVACYLTSRSVGSFVSGTPCVASDGRARRGVTSESGALGGAIYTRPERLINI